MAERLSKTTIDAIDRMTGQNPYTKPVGDEDLQIEWVDNGFNAVVREYRTGYLLMVTYSGYVSSRLTDRQVRILRAYLKQNGRKDRVW